MRILLVAIFLGLFCVLVSGFGSQGAFAVGLLLSAASLAVGGLAGFLFGVPRSLQGTVATVTVGGDAQQGTQRQAEESARRYATNTNLEQISDWLTKILVGVGLTQLDAISGGLKSSAAYFGAALGPSGEPLAVCIMVYFSISGFFYTYLWTRLILLGVMSRADQDATEKLRRIEEQDEIDLRAMTIVDRYLAGRAGPGDPAALAETIENASARARKLIFYEAEEARTRSWRQNKAVVERTIPIFRALVAADHDELYYKTKAKLAYALKDQREPSAKELNEAIALLTEAIERRNLRCEVIPLYEFNRALCRIMLDENFRAGRPSDPDDRALICADLDAVRPSLGEKLGEEPIARWLELNQPSPAAAPVAAAPLAALPKAG